MLNARLLLLLSAGIFLLSAGVHSFVVSEFYPATHKKIFEGPRQTVLGDFAYYVDGTLSLFQVEPVLKFNDKKEPILGKTKVIKEGDFPGWAKYVLLLYPYPSFKFGYSLLVAAVTWPVSDDFFQHRVPRLAFANVIFNSLLAVFIYLSVSFATRTHWIGVLPAALVIFDYSNLHNSYSYMSHTSSGLMLLFAALAIFLAPPRLTPLRLGLGAFLLVFAGFTSSHVYIEAALAGLVCWSKAMIEARSMRERVTMTAAATIGVAITPAYVLGVEALLGFQALGLPSFLSQFVAYSAVVDLLIATYPWYARQMWDFRLFNPFVPLMALAIVVGLVMAWRSNRRAGRSEPRRRWNIRGVASALADPKCMIIFPFVVSLLVAAIYSQPISRASTSHLIVGEVLLGLLLGWMIRSNARAGAVVAGVTLICAAAGSWIVHHTALGGPLQSVHAPWRQVPEHVFLIKESETVSQLTHEYYSHIGKWLIPGDRYTSINKDLKEFLDRLDKQFKGNFGGLEPGQYDDAWVAFDALDVVAVYASTRRFWRIFTEIPENLVTPDTYRKDFKLIITMFQLADSGALGAGNAFKLTKVVWPFGLWDQESHYTMGYLGGVRPFLKSTPLESIDLHAIYFFNVGALRKTLSAQPTGTK